MLQDGEKDKQENDEEDYARDRAALAAPPALVRGHII
jgi:hypothetical protein